MTRAPALTLVVTALAVAQIVAMPMAHGWPAADRAHAPDRSGALGAVAAASVPAPVPAAVPVTVPPTVTRLTTTIGGLERHWVLASPALAAGRPVDLVIALHGVGNDGSQMRALGLEGLAIPDGVAVAFPDAAYGAWNDGRPGADVLSPDGRGADDIAFLRTVISRSGIEMQRTIRSVGVIGFSNGAMMTARVACEMSDIVSVVAIVAGSAPEGFQGACRPQEPVSVAIVADRGDPVVPYDGGQVAPYQGRPRGLVSGVDATVAFWVHADACHATATPSTSPATPPVGAAEADGCQATRRVMRFTIDDAAHEWRRAGGFDTTSVVWSFVRTDLLRIASDDDAARVGLSVAD